MRKLIVSIMVSMDGFIEGDDKNIDWHVWDQEMSDYMNEFFKSIDTILFGRITYQLMEKYWPTHKAETEEPVIANWMNSLSKIVFSKTLRSVHWNNTTIISENAEKTITELKQKSGSDLVIFGGSDLVSSLTRAGLIDEYRIVVNPVLIGRGKPLFNGITDKLTFSLKGVKTFSCGNVLLNYKK